LSSSDLSQKVPIAECFWRYWRPSKNWWKNCFT